MTFFLDTNLGFLTLEGPGCHTVDNRSFSVAPPKFHEYDGSNGLCERSLASKLSAHCFDTFSPVQAKKLVTRWILGENQKNFNGKIVLGSYPRNPYALRICAPVDSRTKVPSCLLSVKPIQNCLLSRFQECFLISSAIASFSSTESISTRWAPKPWQKSLAFSQFTGSSLNLGHQNILLWSHLIHGDRVKVSVLLIFHFELMYRVLFSTKGALVVITV